MRKIIYGLVIVCVVVGGIVWATNSAPRPATKPASSTAQKVDNPQKKSSNAFDKTRYSLTNPNSIWVIVNKQHPINPLSFAPTDLVAPNVSLRVPGLQEMDMRRTAASALKQMFAAASATGFKLVVSTAYRSYSYQKTLYNQYVAEDGQASADTYSARPGYSEHQTGLALDIRNRANTCSLEACFGTTPEGEWLAANAYQYGFILRYPADKEAVTGYEYEPWHFRYVGTYLSSEMHTQGIETLEEFFNVSGGTTYK